MLMIGVLVLLLVFQTSSRLASAYGMAVTGAMFVDTLLAYRDRAADVEVEAAGRPALLLVPLVAGRTSSSSPPTC